MKLTLSEIVKGIQEKKFSPREVLQGYLERIDAFEEKVRAFITLRPREELLAEAEKISSASGALVGALVAVKDNLNVQGLKTTCGSKMLKDYQATYEATVVKRLKAEGALILGKTNMDEFAFGSSTENSSFQVTRNPYDLTRVPGGSSGGSAAAVSAGLCSLALGSDTGGSIRQPAAFCGVVGFKPTYGRVSRYGLVAFASSLDQVGPLSKTVDDAWLAMSVICGLDPQDPTSSATTKIKPRHQIVRPKSIGYCPDLLNEGIDEEIKKAFYQAITLCQDLGIKTREVHLPHIKYGLSVYYLLATSEVSSNLARFDGLRYGLRMPEDDYQQMIASTRGAGFGREVKRRILLGTFALSSGYYQDYYLKAKKVQELIRRDFQAAFAEVDLLLMPTTPTLPFKVTTQSEEPLKMYKADLFTIPVNLAGLPAISLPFSLAQGLPIGMQIIGKHFAEEEVLTAAWLMEKEISVFPEPTFVGG